MVVAASTVVSLYGFPTLPFVVSQNSIWQMVNQPLVLKEHSIPISQLSNAINRS